MNAIEFLRAGLQEVHEALREDVTGTPPEWLTWRPTPDANHIGFLFWHVVRTEDNAIQRHVQRSPSLWETEQWYERWGLEPGAIGTGFTSEQVAKIVFPLDNVLLYAERVWANTDTVLQTLTDADLDREITMERGGQTVAMSIGRYLRMTPLGHNYWHLGEIRYIKGLQGWRFRA